jgi:hypothetical protein
MPEEVVESSGRLQCLFGPNNVPTWFIQLAHVEHAYMLLSTKERKEAAASSASSRRNSLSSGGRRSSVGEHALHIPAVEVFYLEELPEEETAVETSGRLYYRVLVPIELRKGPDLLAPVISRQLFKNAEEIIECHRTYRCPQSGVTFVKLAYEDGWLFETLNSGIRVLEKLATQPDIEYGQFYYVVKIPVGIRVAPNIMAQRSGKGFKLHSIVEASQRFTPPGSKVTYVRVCKDKNARCGCWRGSPPGTYSPVKRMVPGGGSHRLELPGATDRSTTSDDADAGDDLTPSATAMDLSDQISAESALVGPAFPPAPTSCHGGWIFETTMDGQVVLEPMTKPFVRQVERLFYRVLEDVAVLPTPGSTMGKRNSSAPLSNRKRLKDTLIECSERLVPVEPALTRSATPSSDTSDSSLKMPEFGFVKLRHDAGWICERQLHAPYRLVLEQVQGFAVTRDVLKLYRVLLPVHLRSAPDFECPRLPGMPPIAAGTVFESSLQYTPPGSSITYIKMVQSGARHGGSSAVNGGWLFDQTPSGDRVLEAVDEDPEQKNGKFFYRVVCEKKEVLLSPEKSSEVVRYLFNGTVFAAEMEYKLPRSQEVYVRLSKEKGWVALDLPTEDQGAPDSENGSTGRRRRSTVSEVDGVGAGHGRSTVVRLSEELYNLYTMPPSWVSIGFPNRTWFKVPDELCRTILAEETVLQTEIFAARNVLATSSQGRENVPLSRHGMVVLDNGRTEWKCTLEEIKHSASALMFTFPWKQVWWIFEVNGPEDKHCVELQHGLRGGFRSILFDGQVLLQNRSVTDILWDSGSEFAFSWENHTIKVLISLEGAFFSQYLQFYSYSLLVDEEEVSPVPF